MVPTLALRKGWLNAPLWVPILCALSLGLAVAPAQGQESWKTDFERTTVSMDEIVSGGPPKDGIPAIDHPRFVSVSEADEWVADREPAAVVRMGGAVHIYPHQILIWHEIVNDVVGGQAVSVTFCPLCNTTLAFDRHFEGLLLDFGTTGRLRHSDLVMYDRQTETWWQQATGEGIVGEHAGAQLTMVPAPVMSWGEIKREFPNAQVLSRETGYSRRYGDNPYEGYDRRSGPMDWAFRGRHDSRLPAMERVVAVHEGGESVAVSFAYMEDERVVEFEAGGKSMVAFWASGTASALDRAQIARGRDVGASAVFERSLDGRLLTFRAEDEGRFRDRETESVWTLAGDAVAGPLRGSRLSAVPHGNHFWFAWITFRTDTRLIK